ncbi:TPA: glycoside hydrolase family 25 protein [Streptococcus suis]|uniref:glycoside hydrolase family 25 protein n=1 Tax=Streptococcus suis TaxID=1307 RepID=UPI000CF525DF|nr:glycoside hydrolase family 25 protein [Streptococcus suis]MBY4986730.1 glycoside hydrolase family 25 protein [Streptococcus suis]MBY5039846.1 glycoside hydrolase family 25 protein [Streptococcus suis]MCK3882401.1 glycosyl hydrolase family 25 [Streptococcus suis]MDW8681773.1 glycoside hydrolase family 25 protein [Streptococcus suis]MDW8759806.1 glycoside hydrolase family 25 protein [Streptococcus suis]
MRKKLNPMVVIVFFLSFFVLIFLTGLMAKKPTTTTTTKSENVTAKSSSTTTSSSSYYITNALEMKPIIDVSAWQRPSEIDYDTLSQNISGAIVRIQSGSHIKNENAASDRNGLDKAFDTHIKEFQARNIPVAVYAYVTGKSIENMKEEARSFYKASSKYNPTYYWLDVEEYTMEDMNAGVEAFRKELESLGAKNIGIYIGTYFMEDHSISVDKFDAIWIPTYGDDSGYYNAAPNTDLDYDLHQYTSRGYVNGFANHLDLNLITTLKEPNEVYKKLFTTPE